MSREAEKVYDLPTAASIKSVSVDTLRRAIKSQDPAKSLAAKLYGGRYRVTASALDDWADRWADA